MPNFVAVGQTVWLSVEAQRAS